MRRSFEIRDPRWIAVFFVLIGLVFLAVGWGWTNRTKEFKRTAAFAEGTVTELYGGARRLYTPVFEFYDVEGVRHRIVSRTSSNPPLHRVGERVRVLYRADDPQGARIDGFVELWLGPLVFLVLGVSFVGFGSVVTWFMSGGRLPRRAAKPKRSLLRRQKAWEAFRARGEI